MAVLLPPNASPTERALEQSMALYGNPRDVVIDRLWRPFEAPEEILPWLAWGLGVRRWDPAWPEATRRQAIAGAIDVHRKRGTLAAVETALDAIGAAHDVVERPGGAHHLLSVNVYNSNTLLGETDTASIREYIDDAKRFSVHYDLTLTASLDCSFVGLLAGVAGVQIGDFRLEVDVEPAPLDRMPVLPALADQAGQVGTDVDITLPAATGGDAPLTYSLAGLTAGLQFAPATLRITGAPTAAGTETVTYEVEDADGDTDTATFDFVVAVAPVPPTRTFVLGDVTAENYWEGSWGPIDPALVDGGGEVYLRYFGFIGDHLRLWIASSPTADPLGDGPDLTDAFEVAAGAVTITAGPLSLVIPGPDHASNLFRFSEAPYFWTPSEGGFNDFYRDWDDLGDTDKAMTTIILDDSA